MILSDRVVRRPGGGGGGVTQWSPLAFTPAALIDTGSLTKAGTGFDASTGRLTVVYNTHVAAVDGYQDALARYTVPLLTAFPSFDISRHVLDLGLDCPSFVHGTVEAGLFVGLYDSTTVDASLQGAGVTIWQSTAATDRCARQGTTNHSSLASPGLLDGVALTLSFDSTGDGSVVPAIANVHALLESGRWVAVQTQMAESLRGTPSSWVIGFGASHLSTDDCNNATQVADIVYRVREVSRPFG